jgi:hypothetical protein
MQRQRVRQKAIHNLCKVRGRCAAGLRAVYSRHCPLKVAKTDEFNGWTSFELCAGNGTTATPGTAPAPPHQNEYGVTKATSDEISLFGHHFEWIPIDL